MLGRNLSYVDLPVFQLIAGLRYAFPKTMKRLEPKHPGLVALHDKVAARPNVAAYRASERRIPLIKTTSSGIIRSWISRVACLREETQASRSKL